MKEICQANQEKFRLITENQQIAAAKEVSLDLNVYLKLAHKDRAAMYQWLKRNPEKKQGMTTLLEGAGFKNVTSETA